MRNSRFTEAQIVAILNEHKAGASTKRIVLDQPLHIDTLKIAVSRQF